MMTFAIPTMSCGHCRSTVEAAIRSVDPQALVRIDLAGRTAEIETACDVAEIGRAIETAGYAVTPRDGS